ncbi:MAG TPA: histidinol-phosphatase HisJ family protein [Armatimonadota bacterium]|nr:histidinol-phosphatase HisJ family protein [Armatimonadota bacterium]
MLTSYHNHTTWSDGAPTLAAQIQAARALRLDELGISDHYVLHPSGEPVQWSLPLDLIGDYVLELRAAAAETRDLKLRIGIEADFFPETADALRERLAEYPFDFVIGSVHYVDGFPVDEDARFWNALSAEEVNETWRRYWVRMRELAESGIFDFAAHPDLPKKFGHRPTVDLRSEENAALDALAAAGMAIEINTAGWSLPAAEAYPSPRLLREARKREVPLLINADAHFPEFLTRDFERARALARECGYTELVRYERRERLPVPL